MSYRFNPFTSNFDDIGNSGSSPYFLTPVAAESDLPAGAADGAICVVKATDHIYQYDSATTTWIDTGVNSSASLGSTPNAAGYSLSTVTASGVKKATLLVQPADGTHPGALTSGTQTIGGPKTLLATMYANAGIDVTLTGGTDTLALGTTNADVINIGNPGATINIQGTTLYENVTQLQVTDPNITLNKGGGTGSASTSGLELEENGSITGYAQTSNDRNSWQLKAPNTVGVATIVPGSGGITLNQSSHDPVTIGTANGLSLSTQALSLQLATNSLPGALSAADHTYFNAKVDSVNGKTGNSITLTTSDVGEGTNLYFTDERAQDAVGTILTSSTNVTLTYNDAANTITSDLTATGVANATYGSSVQVPQIAVDLKGRITSASNVTIAGISSTDIADTTFTGSATGTPVSVTGLAFSNAAIRSFEAQVSVVSSGSYQAFKLSGIQKGASWDLSQSSTGDNAAVVFSINNSGQIQYISTNSVTLHFRAQTLAV